MNLTTITPAQLSELCRSGRPIELIDVRTPAEFREVHVTVAKNAPLDQLDPAALMAARGGSSDAPLYLICKSGGRSTKACEQFIKAGFTNVVNVEGGTTACVEAGVPVVRGQPTMSLERQVRIAAGLLVLIGAVGSYAIDSHMIWLSAFVGAGLVFAGVTNTCGMGMLLARMPWNK
jgi:rhodanese-related sulfurtransferase